MMQTATQLMDRVPIPFIKLKITAELIAKATPGVMTQCSIAQAVRVQVPGARSITVDPHYVKFTAPGKDRDGVEKLMRYAYPQPAHAAVKAIAFDESGKMEPFNMSLQPEHAFAAPSVRRHNVGRGPTRNRSEHAETARRCIRRYHAGPVIKDGGTVLVGSQDTVPAKKKRKAA